MKGMLLSLSSLLIYLEEAIQEISDPRQASNGTKYQLKDAVLAAFSVFFTQSESFLEYQRQMESRHGKSNAQTLFGVQKIPSVPQIRNILDGVAASSFFGLFRVIYHALRRGGYLQAFEYLGGHLIALDGTQYFSSQKVYCQNCSHCTHKTGQTTYSHGVILPVIVSPEQSEVIFLTPEFITPQDGSEKQDCEVAAAKRWVLSHAAEFEGQPVTLLGDDLFSHQPMCQTVLGAQMNYIFTCLPTSHTDLYDWLTQLESIGEVQTFQREQLNKKSKEIYHYRYVNRVPLAYPEGSLLVNWCELTVTRYSDGAILYHNAFITHHHLTEETVPLIAAAGRCRWKTENENHNILKTKGYHLEHNFGHGQHHLAACLLTLNLLAFLFHTVLQLVDSSYQNIRQKRGTRKGFFQDILTLTKYFLFQNWQHLIDFMLYGSPAPIHTDSS
jgi:hypothetical protein